MIRTAAPGTTAGSGGDPAAISPMTGSTMGECRAFATSSARTAYPSMAELGSGGIEMAERTSSDRTSPLASASDARDGVRGRISARTRSSASSTSIMSVGVVIALIRL